MYVKKFLRTAPGMWATLIVISTSWFFSKEFYEESSLIANICLKAKYFQEDFTEKIVE